jgi:hypothetical protein
MDSWNFAEEEKSMKLFKTIDERIRECGFRKVKEDANGALYENDDECIKHIVRVTEKSILNYIDNRKEAGMAQKLVEANCPYLKVGERVPNLNIDDSQWQLRFA